jgi:hypothetical protein
MRTRLLIAVLVVSSSVSLACRDREGAGSATTRGSPAAPSPFVSLPPTWITISGRTSLGAPGETTQLRASATFLDGTRSDLTDKVGWSVCGTSQGNDCPGSPYKVANVDPNDGRVVAVAYGRTNVIVVYPRGATGDTPGAVRGWTPFRVVPDGMAVVSGHVTAGGSGLAGAVVELETPAAPMRFVTGASGAFMFAPVAGDVRLRTWHEGFCEVTHSLSVYHDEEVALELPPLDVAIDVGRMRGAVGFAPPSVGGR